MRSRRRRLIQSMSLLFAITGLVFLTMHELSFYCAISGLLFYVVAVALFLHSLQVDRLEAKAQ